MNALKRHRFQITHAVWLTIACIAFAGGRWSSNRVAETTKHSGIANTTIAAVESKIADVDLRYDFKYLPPSALSEPEERQVFCFTIPIIR